MKTFKQHINEKMANVPILSAYLEQGKFESAAHVVKYLQIKGWAEQQDKGSTARIWYHESDRDAVLKVSRGASAGERGAIKFLQYCQENQPHTKNSLFPRVFKVHQFENSSWVAILEYLRPMTYAEVEQKTQTGMVDSFMLFMAINHPESEDYEKYMQKLEPLGFEKEKMENFLKIIKGLGYRQGDSHPGNYGYRPNGDLVFFDPVTV